MDDITFINKDKQGFLYQPNMVRWRHCWKSPRDSLKINQELGQTYFDIANLRYRQELFSERIEEAITLIDDGGLVGDVEYNVHDDATPSDEAFVLEGLEAITIRVEALNRRLYALEGQ